MTEIIEQYLVELIESIWIWTLGYIAVIRITEVFWKYECTICWVYSKKLNNVAHICTSQICFPIYSER